MATSSDHDHLPDYWLAYLAGAIRNSLRHPPAPARAILSDALAQFKRSRVCSDNLRQHLKGE